MSTIYTRTGKGSALTWTEADANITNLNTDKMESFTVAGDTGTSQTISGGNTLTISGGTGLTSVASATDVLTINLDNTAVTAASYTYASITVDAQGRLTAASSGTTPLTSGGALGTPSSGTVTNLTGTASININGTVGATTASTGAFTTLSATGAVTLSPASLAVAISPTGTGTVAISPAGALTINPTTASTINNTSIGATTAATGRFTTVQSTVATGTAPFTVASTTQVANLNAATAGTATNATNVAITGSASTNANYFLPFVAANSSTNQALNTTSTITYNPNTFVFNVPNGQNTTLQVSGWNSPFVSTGSAFRTSAGTFTDTTTASGTVAADYYNVFGAPTRASTNAITVTDLATLFVGAPATSTNTTATNKYALLTTGTVKAKEYQETIFDIGASGATTLTPDAANGNVQTISATGNFTLSAFANPRTGQTITFIITQDGTGTRTLTSTMKFAGGSKTLSTAAASIDILTVSYIGTTYYASLSKAFA